MKTVIIENVSRRRFLAGVAATGGLVLSAQVLPLRGALAAEAAKYGADAMPHGTVNDPRVFV
jgi:isoquinoline 1-oxidoreductase beta subunit